MLKKHILVFLILFFFAPKVQSEEKIAFIDLNLIYNNSTAGKKINEEISERNKKIKSEFENFQKKLDKEKEKLVKQKNVIAKEEYQKKVLELEKKVKEYNSIIQEKNNKLAKYKNKARLEFLKIVQSILAEYSKNNSLSMILKKENILIGKTNLDITGEILKIFNKEIKSIKFE